MDPTNFDAISFAGMKGQSEKTNAVNTAYGVRDIGGIQGDMYRDIGQFEAMGIKAQGEAKGQASMMSGLASGIGSLAGGIANMPGAGASPTGQPIPTNMQPLNGTPSYLSPNSSPISLENYGSVLDQW